LLNVSEVSYAELRGNIRSAETRGAVKDKVKVILMMMMTFHNFAGYEFIFAFKQPDVTYVTSSFF